jgi:hypothetical protein
VLVVSGLGQSELRIREERESKNEQTVAWEKTRSPKSVDLFFEYHSVVWVQHQTDLPAYWVIYKSCVLSLP